MRGGSDRVSVMDNSQEEGRVRTAPPLLCDLWSTENVYLCIYTAKDKSLMMGYLTDKLVQVSARHIVRHS